MKYVEPYAGAAGVSHFREVEIDPEQATFPPPGEPWTPNGGIGVIRRAAGRTSDVHPPPEPRCGAFRAGLVEYRAGDGEVRRSGIGDLFLSGDTTSNGPTTATLGDADAWSLCLRVDAAAGGR